MIYFAEKFSDSMLSENISWIHIDNYCGSVTPVADISESQSILEDGDMLFVPIYAPDYNMPVIVGSPNPYKKIVSFRRYIFGDPELLVKTHNTDGSDHDYDASVTLVPSRNGNIPKPRETRCAYSFSSYYSPSAGIDGYIKPLD